MRASPANIHDSFFKRMMSESQIAATFLREHLPRSIVDLLTADPPEQLSGSFVDEDLSQYHSDLLFRVRLRTGDDALAYLLVEHKSAPDRLARLQLLRYVTRILVGWHNENRVLPLPPVVPILIHQGPQGWGWSDEFDELYGDCPATLRPYLVSFRHALIDLAKIEDPALSVHIRLRSFLKAMKYVQRKDLPDHFHLLLLDASALANADVLAILNYITRGPVPVSREVIQDALNQLEPERSEEIMERFGDSFIREGFERGIAEGEAKILTRLLERRFGSLPEGLRERVVSADVGLIEEWVDRAIDATDLQSVFTAQS